MKMVCLKREEMRVGGGWGKRGWRNVRFMVGEVIMRMRGRGVRK